MRRPDECVSVADDGCVYAMTRFHFGAARGDDVELERFHTTKCEEKGRARRGSTARRPQVET
jgi:hypothetical protein